MIRSCSAGNWFLDNSNLFQVAKLIDSKFIGNEKTFKVERRNGIFFISTNKDDESSIIAVTCLYINACIEKIERLDLDEDKWKEITQKDYDKVEEYLLSLP